MASVYKVYSDTQLTNLIKSVILEDKKAEYPVGSILFNTSNKNPSTYLGFGTWVAWGSGRVPVGVGPGDAEFNTVEKTGGAKEHFHYTDPLWAVGYDNKYYIGFSNNQGVQSVGIPKEYANAYYGNEVQLMSTSVNPSGMCMYASLNGSSLQPYITCYMWKRTA